VCPSCKSSEYVNNFTVWHGVVAIFFFPLGLIALAFPVKRCENCKSPHGAGLAVVRVIRAVAIAALIIFALIVAVVIVVAAMAATQ